MLAVVGQWFSSGMSCHKGHWLGTSVVVTTRGDPGIKGVGAREAAPHPAAPRTPLTGNDPALNVCKAKRKKP